MLNITLPVVSSCLAIVSLLLCFMKHIPSFSLEFLEFLTNKFPLTISYWRFFKTSLNFQKISKTLKSLSGLFIIQNVGNHLARTFLQLHINIEGSWKKGKSKIQWINEEKQNGLFVYLEMMRLELPMMVGCVILSHDMRGCWKLSAHSLLLMKLFLTKTVHKNYQGCQLKCNHPYFNQIQTIQARSHRKRVMVLLVYDKSYLFFVLKLLCIIE